jgi:hypothetical protein
MLREMLWVVVLGAMVSVVGCSSGVGNDGDIVGGACVVSSQCAMESRCLTGASFPAGYCAKTCGSDEDCPGGSECVQVEGGVCMVSCGSSAECRSGDGYGCVSREARGAAGTRTVCALP